MRQFVKKYLGDRRFYTMLLAVIVPIMVQNGITNFVSLLDNIMVGRVGTEQMSGVAITNQLMFVFNIAVFGVISGAGIFGAQFYGSGDKKGVQDAFRFKILSAFFILIVACILFWFGGEWLIRLYLHGEENKVALEATLQYGKEYLLVMMIGLPPFALVQSYTSTLRECGETVVPMKAGIAAVLVNLCLNALLIFGMFGFPALGVVGAAVATVVSRYVEMAIVVIWAHRHADKYPFIKGAYRSFRIPAQLATRIFVKGTPLMFNEILWAMGMATLVQCYSTRGLDAVAAFNITSTISNLFSVVYISLGSAVSIIIGQLLGAGKMDEAKETDRRLLVFGVLSCAAIGVVLAILAPLFPQMYNTTDTVRDLASKLILVVAVYLPIGAFLNTCYFTLRAGGKTIVTFFFDGVFMWCVSIPFAYVLSRFTAVPIVQLYLACQMIELIKCVIGYVLVKKGVWISNLVK